MRVSTIHNHVRHVLLITTCAFGSCQAAAQEAPSASSATQADSPNPDNEIVVTAQKRSQRINDVALAITAVTGDQLIKQGFVNSTQIAAFTPGLSLSGSSGSQTTQFSIRGVIQNDYSDTVEAPVAVYIDEGYVGFSQAQVFALFDLDRVEVLKGPQGTLFGRNATGGVVSYNTRKPTRELDGFVDLTYGSYNQVRTEAAIGGPIGGMVSGRLSVLYNTHDPILKNVYPFGAPAGTVGSTSGHSDLWNDNQKAARGQLLFDFGAATWLVSGYASTKTVSSANWQHLATTAVVNAAGSVVDVIKSADDPLGCITLSTSGRCVGRTRPVQGGDFIGYRDPKGADHVISQDYARLDSNCYRTQGATSNLSWDLGGATLTAISHFMHNSKRQAQDTDESPLPQTVVMNNSRNDTFTQEVRMSGATPTINWVAGAYYLYLNTRYNQGLADAPGGFGVFGPGPGGAALEGDNSARLKTNSYSGFGQIDWRFAPQLTLVLGGRAIAERKAYDYVSGFYINTDDTTVDNVGTPVSPFLPAYSARTRDFLWAAKGQLEYRPSQYTMVYAGVNRGTKAGNFNVPLLSALTPDQYRYGPEKLLSYEGGFKVRIPDAKVQLNGNVFYYDYKDYQAFAFEGVSGIVTSTKARYKGAELSVDWQPTSALGIQLGASYIDAVIPDLAISSGVSRDVRPAFTPKYKITHNIRYEVDRPVMDGRVSMNVNGAFTSPIYLNIQNFSGFRTPSYYIANARIAWTSLSQRLEIAAFLNNISDVRNRTTSVELSGLCGCSEQAYGLPRWAGLQARLSFR